MTCALSVRLRARWTVCVMHDSVCEVARWVSHGHAAGASQYVVLACQPVGVGTPCMQGAERGRGGACGEEETPESLLSMGRKGVA